MYFDLNSSFKVGPFDIYYYGIFVTLGFFATVLFSYLEWKKKGYSKYHFRNVFWISLIMGLWGARLWYLAFNPTDYNGLISLFSISQGRSILGTIFFVWFFNFLYIKYFAPDIEWRYTASIILPNILLGQAIGRWGNFFDQNVYGLVVENPNGGAFGLLPPFISNNMLIDGAYRQPFFLYESFVDLLGWVLIAKIAKYIKQIKPGTHAGMYFLWYGITRASMENFRDQAFIMKIGNFHTSFWLSILFILLGLVIMIYYQFFYKQAQFFYEYQWVICREMFKNEFRNIFNTEVKKENRKSFKNDLKNTKQHQSTLYNSIYEYYYQGE